MLARTDARKFQAEQFGSLHKELASLNGKVETIAFQRFLISPVWGNPESRRVVRDYIANMYENCFQNQRSSCHGTLKEFNMRKVCSALGSLPKSLSLTCSLASG